MDHTTTEEEMTLIMVPFRVLEDGIPFQFCTDIAAYEAEVRFEEASEDNYQVDQPIVYIRIGKICYPAIFKNGVWKKTNHGHEVSLSSVSMVRLLEEDEEDPTIMQNPDEESVDWATLGDDSDNLEECCEFNTVDCDLEEEE